MSEDKTYCYNLKCKNKKCERHSDNIKVHYIPHSFAFFTSCKYWATSSEKAGEQE